MSEITEKKDTNRVVQTVLKSGEKFLIAKRSNDGYWEFMGGKVKKKEKLREAARRELNEETDLNLEKDDFKAFRKGKSYRSEADSKYILNPVLIEINEEKASEMSIEGLSTEHTDFEWIDLQDFYSFETLGQYRALENLGIVNGDVALAVAEKEGKYLLLKRSENTSSSGLWNFPGGKVESEERDTAALRELKEETGLSGEIIERGRPYIGTGELGYWRIFPFLVEADGSVELNKEHKDFIWTDLGLEEYETLGTSKAVQRLDLKD